MRRSRAAVAVLAVAGCGVGAIAADAHRDSGWSPGQGDALPEFARYANEGGEVGIYNAAGRVETKGHPFFEPIGTNGRACITCHQPSDGMSISVKSIRERWDQTQGMDPASITPEEFRRLGEQDAQRWAELIKAQNIQAQ